jgi:hypothetical protein
LTIEGKKTMAKSFTVGGYEVQDVKRGMKKGASVSGGPVQAKKSEQKFSFNLAAEGESYGVDCTLVDKKLAVGGINTGDGKGENMLDCQFADWAIKLDGSQGTLQGAQSFEIVTWKKSRMLPRPGGYYFKASGEDVAAVDGIKLMVRKEVEPNTKAALAAAAVALLLYSDTSPS